MWPLFLSLGNKRIISAWINIAESHRRWRRGVGGRPPPRAWKISGQTLFSGQAQVAQKSWMIKNVYSIQWIQGTLCVSGQAHVVKSPECQSIFNRVENFRATLFFRASASCSKVMNGEKIFNTVYIYLWVICVIWTSVVCNLDQSRD